MLFALVSTLLEFLHFDVDKLEAKSRIEYSANRTEYILMESNKTWVEARQDCYERFGQLVVMENKSQYVSHILQRIFKCALICLILGACEASDRGPDCLDRWLLGHQKKKMVVEI